MQRRSQRVPVPIELGDADSPFGIEAGAPDSFERLVTGIEVREAMMSLSEAHREVLELSFDEDLRQQEIADRLAIPIGTVKTRTYHALRAMKAELAERGIDV
jgi:RNA polymerase sigma-70 factor, ECF subfamily